MLCPVMLKNLASHLSSTLLFVVLVSHILSVRSVSLARSDFGEVRLPGHIYFSLAKVVIRFHTALLVTFRPSAKWFIHLVGDSILQMF